VRARLALRAFQAKWSASFAPSLVPRVVRYINNPGNREFPSCAETLASRVRLLVLRTMLMCSLTRAREPSTHFGTGDIPVVAATRSMIDGIHLIEGINDRSALSKVLDKPHLDVTTPLGRGIIAFLSAWPRTKGTGS
jgi:hypothetical protein